MASSTRLAACWLSDFSDSIRDWFLLDGFSELEGWKCSIAAWRSIPSNTRSAACILPLWYSSLPRKALASYKVYTNNYQILFPRIFYTRNHQKFQMLQCNLFVFIYTDDGLSIVANLPFRCSDSVKEHFGYLRLIWKIVVKVRC